MLHGSLTQLQRVIYQAPERVADAGHLAALQVGLLLVRRLETWCPELGPQSVLALVQWLAALEP
jgi:hypothetical protein